MWAFKWSKIWSAQIGQIWFTKLDNSAFQRPLWHYCWHFLPFFGDVGTRKNCWEFANIYRLIGERCLVREETRRICKYATEEEKRKAAHWLNFEQGCKSIAPQNQHQLHSKSLIHTCCVDDLDHLSVTASANTTPLHHHLPDCHHHHNHHHHHHHHPPQIKYDSSSALSGALHLCQASPPPTYSLIHHHHHDYHHHHHHH